jgi:hypothetical protein
VSWLLLAALGMMWAAFLYPGRKGSPSNSVKDFERNMDLLADTEQQGRWIITPRKGMAFIGPRARAQARVRERRRRVLVFLLESIGLTFLIGIVPPLRAMWLGTALLIGLLAVYAWGLVRMKSHGEVSAVARERTPKAANGHAAISTNGHASVSTNGYAARPKPARTVPSEDDADVVIVQRASGVDAVRA